MRKPYPTDLSNEEWEYIEPHMPPPKGHGREAGGSGIGKGAEEIVCVEFEQIPVHDGHDSTLFR
jgi:hypothetical protein